MQLRLIGWFPESTACTCWLARLCLCLCWRGFYITYHVIIHLSGAASAHNIICCFTRLHQRIACTGSSSTILSLVASLPKKQTQHQSTWGSFHSHLNPAKWRKYVSVTHQQCVYIWKIVNTPEQRHTQPRTRRLSAIMPSRTQYALWSNWRGPRAWTFLPLQTSLKYVASPKRRHWVWNISSLKIWGASTRDEDLTQGLYCRNKNWMKGRAMIVTNWLSCLPALRLSPYLKPVNVLRGQHDFDTKRLWMKTILISLGCINVNFNFNQL